MGFAKRSPVANARRKQSSKRSAVAGAMAEVASAVHEDERAAVVTAAGEASAESAASADHASATTAAPAVAVAIPERPPTRFVKRSPLKDAMARKLEAAAAAGEPSDDESFSLPPLPSCSIVGQTLNQSPSLSEQELVEAATRWRSSLPPRLPSKFKRQFPRFQSRPRPGTHLTEVVLNLSGSAAAQEKQLEPAPVSDASVSAAEEVAVTQEEDVGDIEAVVEAAPNGKREINFEKANRNCTDPFQFENIRKEPCACTPSDYAKEYSKGDDGKCYLQYRPSKLKPVPCTEANVKSMYLTCDYIRDPATNQQLSKTRMIQVVYYFDNQCNPAARGSLALPPSDYIPCGYYSMGGGFRYDAFKDLDPKVFQVFERSYDVFKDLDLKVFQVGAMLDKQQSARSATTRARSRVRGGMRRRGSMCAPASLLLLSFPSAPPPIPAALPLVSPIAMQTECSFSNNTGTFPCEGWYAEEGQLKVGSYDPANYWLEEECAYFTNMTCHNNLQSSLKLPLTLVRDGTRYVTFRFTVSSERYVTFRFTVSSERQRDGLVFYIDDLNTPAMLLAYNQEVRFPLAAGRHTLVWAYVKDSSFTQGRDSAALQFLEVDGIAFTDSACLKCPAGFFSGEQATNCTACPPDHISAEGSGQCEACNSTTFALATPRTQCTPRPLCNVTVDATPTFTPCVASSRTRTRVWSWLSPQVCQPDPAHGLPPNTTEPCGNRLSSHTTASPLSLGYSPALHVSVVHGSVVLALTQGVPLPPCISLSLPLISQHMPLSLSVGTYLSSLPLAPWQYAVVDSATDTLTCTFCPTVRPRPTHSLGRLPSHSVPSLSAFTHSLCHLPLANPCFGTARNVSEAPTVQPLPPPGAAAPPSAAPSTTSDETCHPCQPGEAAVRMLLLEHFRTVEEGKLPSGFQTGCSGECGSGGWRVVGDYLDSGANNGKTASVWLALTVNLTIPGYITYDFACLCATQAHPSPPLSLVSAGVAGPLTVNLTIPGYITYDFDVWLALTVNLTIPGYITYDFDVDIPPGDLQRGLFFYVDDNLLENIEDGGSMGVSVPVGRSSSQHWPLAAGSHRIMWVWVTLNADRTSVDRSSAILHSVRVWGAAQGARPGVCASLQARRRGRAGTRGRSVLLGITVRAGKGCARSALPTPSTRNLRLVLLFGSLSKGQSEDWWEECAAAGFYSEGGEGLGQPHSLPAVRPGNIFRIGDVTSPSSFCTFIVRSFNSTNTLLYDLSPPSQSTFFASRPLLYLPLPPSQGNRTACQPCGLGTSSLEGSAECAIGDITSPSSFCTFIVRSFNSTDTLLYDLSPLAHQNLGRLVGPIYEGPSFVDLQKGPKYYVSVCARSNSDNAVYRPVASSAAAGGAGVGGGAAGGGGVWSGDSGGGKGGRGGKGERANTKYPCIMYTGKPLNNTYVCRINPNLNEHSTATSAHSLGDTVSLAPLGSFSEPQLQRRGLVMSFHGESCPMSDAPSTFNLTFICDPEAGYGHPEPWTEGGKKAALNPTLSYPAWANRSGDVIPVGREAPVSCLFQMVWYTAYACPLCTVLDMDPVAVANCIDNKRFTYKYKTPRLCQPNPQVPLPPDEYCLPCTKDDYQRFEDSCTDANGVHNVTYIWKLPKTCNEDLSGAEKLPEGTLAGICDMEVKLSVHVGGNATISGSNDRQILALEASFGAGLPKTKADALSFSLAQMQPLLACSDPPASSPFSTCAQSPFQGQAVLVQRGDCSFASKALRVQRLGAAAAIVINSEEGIIGMGCNATDLTEGVVTIPVVMVSNSSGQFLLHALSNASASPSASASAAPVTVSLYAPPRSLLDLAELVLWALALLSLVGASAWAAAEEKAALEGRVARGSPWRTSPRAAPREHYDIHKGDSSGAYDMSVGVSSGFRVVMSSVMLLLLFFLMSPLVFYIILTLFCVAALESLYVCLSSLLHRSVNLSSSLFPPSSLLPPVP
ncbi:unnamed protein product [Closterium sp. NIES-65]|nr:unnamed protein product [Closterium sp. NIES-65]